MQKLSTRERTRINAALSYIHSAGYDVHNVVRTAKSLMSHGRDENSAYEGALEAFLRVIPAATSTLTRIIRLVEASDDATVARYDLALKEYIETGSEAGLTALAPTVAADARELAVVAGEITPEQAAANPDSWGELIADGSAPAPLPGPAAAPAPQVPEGVMDATGFSVVKASHRWTANAGPAPQPENAA